MAERAALRRAHDERFASFRSHDIVPGRWSWDTMGGSLPEDIPGTRHPDVSRQGRTFRRGFRVGV